MRSKKIVLFVVVPLTLLAVLAVLAPTLLSGFVRGRLEREIGARAQGTVRVGGVSLGWFSPQRIEGLVIDGGPETGSVDASAEVAEGILALLQGSDITVTLRGSASTAFDAEGRIGLAQLMKPAATAGPADGPSGSGGPSPWAGGQTPLGARTLRVKLDGVALSATGPAGAKYALEKLEGELSLAGTTLAAAIDGVSTASGREGEVSIDLSLACAFDPAGVLDLARTTGSATVAATRLAWPTAAGELVSSSVRAELAKDAQGTLKLRADIVARLGESAESTVAESTVAADIELTEAIAADGAFSLDPAKLRASVEVRGLPMGALQPFAPRLAGGVQPELARDVGETANLTVVKQLGERARIVLESKQLSLAFDGAVAADGSSIDGGTLEARAALRPELLRALGLVDPATLEIALRGERIAWRKADDLSRAIGGACTVELARPFEFATTADPARIRLETLAASLEKDLASPAARATLAAAGRLGATGDGTLSATAELDIASRALVKGAVDAGIRLDGELLERATKGAVTARGADATLRIAVPELAYIPSADFTGLDALVARVRAELAGAVSVEGAGATAAVNDLAIEFDTPRGSTPGSLSLGAKVDGASVRIEQRFARLPQGSFDLARVAPSGTVAVAGLDPSFVARLSPQAAPWVGLLGRGAMKLDVRNGMDRGALAADFTLDAASIDGSGSLRIAADAVSAANLTVDAVLAPEGLASLELPEGTEIDPGARLSLRAPAVALSRTDAGWRPTGDLVARVIVESLRVRRAPGIAAPIGLARLDANASYAFADERATLVGAASLDDRAGEAEFSIRWRKPVDARLFHGLEGSLALSSLDVARLEAPLSVAPGRISGLLGGVGSARVELTEATAPRATIAVDFPSLDGSLAVEVRETADGRIADTKGVVSCELAATALDRLAGLDKKPGTRFLAPASITLTVAAASVPLDADLRPRMADASLDATGSVSALSLESRDPKGVKTPLSTGALAITVRGARLGDSITLAAKGDPAASATGSLEVDATVLGAFGELPVLEGTLRSTGLPSATLDAMAGTNGSVARYLGASVTASLVAKGLSAKGGTLSATLDTPTATVVVEPVRIDGGFVRLVKEPTRASLELTPPVREQLLASIHPFFSDVVASERARFTVESLAWPLDGDLRKFDAAFTLEVGEARLVNREGVSLLLSLAGAGRADGFEAKFGQLRATVEKGRLVYRDFRIEVGKSAAGAWKNSLVFTGDVDLGARPMRANSIQTLVPLRDLANWSREARDFAARADAVSPAIVDALKVGVEWSGPIADASGKFTMPAYRVKLPDFGEILKQAGKSLGDDPGAVIESVGDIFDRIRKKK